MTKPLLFLFLSAFPYLAQALSFCDRGSDQIRALLEAPENRLAFKNRGGLINGGVCWWHSRLQRSSVYLSQFSPESPPPSEPELQKILLDLRTMKNVVRIPGYSDFETFSRDYEKEIQALLEGWQRIDGFFNFEWIRGISGNYRLPWNEMQIRMNKVFSFYRSSPVPVWLMAQMKGITSHSFLLLKMEETNSGFDLWLIDSNHPSKTVLAHYNQGDQYLQVEGHKSTFVPYVGFQEDFRKISQTLARHCGRDQLSSGSIPKGEVELPSEEEK
jgi:hypothetical protein